jgi:hypothetical protein
MSAPRPCDRFDREGALALERGDPDEAHLAGCAECRAAHAAYLALARRLADASPTWVASPDWEMRLDRTIAQRAAVRRRRRMLAGLAVAAAAAASVIAYLVVRSPSRDPRPALAVTLALEITRGDDLRRAEMPRVGDLLHLKATAGGHRHAELRVYRGATELVLRCVPADEDRNADGDVCARRGDELTATLRFSAIGHYRVVVVASSSPVPAPQGSLDADTAAARSASADLMLSDILDIL